MDTAPKPAPLGPAYAAQFGDASVAAAYHHRPPYPREVFSLLVGLMPQGRGAALDAGCGTGDLARALAPLVERVDAVDVSAAMIERGRRLPGGDHQSLSWITSSMEEAPLRPPYGLVTAGESLHWMDWSRVLPRLARALAPGGFLAIVGRDELPSPWSSELGELIREYSTNREYRPYDLIWELESRGLFVKVGERRTAVMRFEQPVGSYIESIHSRNGFSRDRMTAEAAGEFDARASGLVRRHTRDGVVDLRIVGRVVWGSPAG